MPGEEGPAWNGGSLSIFFHFEIFACDTTTKMTNNGVRPTTKTWWENIIQVFLQANNSTTVRAHSI